ncbi:MAG: efflux RND transporter periplasmic adaptor subunit [Muribaculaceae bacterium]|nr:efflux RND transporter periplasmic adaptor subunit [Muribaculaceae bacterium]
MDRTLTAAERFRIKRKKMLRIAIAVLIIGFAIWGIWYFSRTGINEKDLSMGTADRGDIEVAINATGHIVPSMEEIISSPVSTRILEVYRHPGDMVKKGSPLMRLDLDATRTDYEKQCDELSRMRLSLEKLQANNNTKLHDMEMRIKVSEMNLNRLNMQLANERYLDSIGGGTADQVREVEFARRSAVLELEQLKQQLANERRAMEADVSMARLDIEIKSKDLALTSRLLGDAEILVPRHATVTSIVNEIGSQISAGQQVAVIADLAHYRIEGEVADSRGRDVRPGCRISFKVAREEFEGTVRDIAPTSRSGMYSFTATIDCDSSEVLRAGLKPDVYISNGLKSGVTRIPIPSGYNGAGSYELYVDNGRGEIERRSVKLGASGYDHVEVISGVSPGERVVLNDMHAFSNSNIIKIIK